MIRTETDLTNLLFTATDKNNRFIISLRQEDIRVLEDGVPQKLFTFQRETDRPLAVALLIDISASEERTLAQEKAAARAFVETIIRSSMDQAAVIPFSGSAFLEQALTRDVLASIAPSSELKWPHQHTNRQDHWSALRPLKTEREAGPRRGIP